MAGAGGGSDSLPVGITPSKPALSQFKPIPRVLDSAALWECGPEGAAETSSAPQPGWDGAVLVGKQQSHGSKAMGWREQRGKGRIFVLVSNGMPLSTLGGNYPRCTNHPS